MTGGGAIDSIDNSNITLNAGSGTVVIGASGTGKLDSGTIDPPYTINGSKYATYMSSMIGIKEEATGTVYTTEEIPGVGYKHTINFKSQPQGSDLWLFAKTTDLKKHIEDLVVLLSPAGKTRAWYTLDTRNYELNIFTNESSLVSYRLTAPRFDADEWLNTRAENESTGFILNDPDEWQENVAGTLIGSTVAISEIFNQIEASYLKVTNLDVADSITLQGSSLKAYITNVVEEVLANIPGSDPGILSPTVETERLTTNFISPLVEGGEIVVEGELTIQGDASISGTLTANEIKSTTIDTIRDRIAALAEEYSSQTATASATPILPGSELPFATLQAAESFKPLTATDSANLDIASINANFGFFSDYLAVMGQTVTTDLKVNNTIAINDNLIIGSSSITSLSGTLDLLSGLITLDASGKVVITGNLTVTGKIATRELEVQSASISGTLIASEIQSPFGEALDIKIASQSAVSIYNTIGNQVASIDASGSASFNKLNLKASGSTTIKAGENNVIVTSTNLTNSSQVIVTFGSDYKPATKYWVTKDPTTNTFTIFVNYPVNNPVNIDWVIIN